MNQTERVLKYLQEHETINSFVCFKELQIVDLQHAIYELRKQDYNITDQWISKTGRNGNKIKYKEYRMES